MAKRRTANSKPDPKRSSKSAKPAANRSRAKACATTRKPSPLQGKPVSAQPQPVIQPVIPPVAANTLVAIQTLIRRCEEFGETCQENPASLPPGRDANVLVEYYLSQSLKYLRLAQEKSQELFFALRLARKSRGAHAGTLDSAK